MHFPLMQTAYVRQCVLKTQSIGREPPPRVSPFLPWGDVVTFVDPKGDPAPRRVADMVEGLGELADGAASVLGCPARSAKVEDARVASANVILCKGDGLVMTACLVVVSAAKKRLALLVPDLFVANVVGNDAKWLRGILSEDDVAEFERKTFGTMWRIGDMNADAALVTTVYTSIVVAHMLRSGSHTASDPLWGLARRAVESAGTCDVALVATEWFDAEWRVMELDISSVPDGGSVGEPEKKKRKASAIAFAEEVIGADRGDCVVNLSPFGDRCPEAWPKVKEWVQEYNDMKDDDAYTADLLLDLLEDFDDACLDCFGPCGLSVEAVKAKLAAVPT